jgi:hypothetical protein
MEGDVVIDPTDTLYNGIKVDGPIALRQVILTRPEQFVGTMTEKLMTYGLGRKSEYYDMPVVRLIVRNAAASNYRFSSLVLGIVKSAAFQMEVENSEDAVNKTVARNNTDASVLVTAVTAK